MNGWRNNETWNVALWIQNDEQYFALAMVYRKRGYKAFAEILGNLYPGSFGICTPDGVEWNHHSLDIKALDELLADL